MIIYLNGPPGSGKDTIADILTCQGFTHRKFATPVRRMFCALHNIYDFQIEQMKEDPRTRQALIELGEGARRVYGQEFFGLQVAKTLPVVGNAVVSDAGFTTEVRCCIDATSSEQEHVLWRIHRKGCTFDGDSRGWLAAWTLGINSLSLYNNGTKAELEAQVLRALSCYQVLEMLACSEK